MPEITYCGICRAGSRTLRPILDLGDQPMAERDDGNRYPLVLLECTQCGLVQLSYMVDQHEMFPHDHPYTTGNTGALKDHFRELAQSLSPYLHAGDLVVDIGANDGTLLAALLGIRPDVRVLAIEPTDQVQRARKQGVPARQEFFTASLARHLAQTMGHAQVIAATNVLAHVPEPHDFMTGVRELLTGDGVFVTENHDWASVVNGLQIDTVYHEHLRYYSVASLSYLLSMHGFLIRRAEPIGSHGGSFRITAFVPPAGIAARAVAARDQLRSVLMTAAQDGPIYGIGAATRATPLIHYAGLSGFLACVCEVPGSDKIGRLMPGTNLPIVNERALIDDQPPHALLFPWHLASSLVPTLRRAGYTGKFIVPLPRPEVLDA